jgi:hypothetical protein
VPISFSLEELEYLNEKKEVHGEERNRDNLKGIFGVLSQQAVAQINFIFDRSLV